MKRILLIDTICYLLVFLFLYAAVSKVMDYEKFRIQIGQSPLLTTMTGFIAWFIPTLEILISVMLVLSRIRLAGLYFSFGLMILFSAYIIAILKFGTFIPCSCGGILQKMTWNTHLIFNICFVIIAALGVFLETSVRDSKRHLIINSS
jgi:Methylamine utilisation protein MauE